MYVYTDQEGKCILQTDERSIPSMEALLEQHIDLSRVRKIGEGTFGEAFKGGSLVVKIVPLEGDVLVNGEPQKRASDILGETAVALTVFAAAGAERYKANAVRFVEHQAVGALYSRTVARKASDRHLVGWKPQPGRSSWINASGPAARRQRLLQVGNARTLRPDLSKLMVSESAADDTLMPCAPNGTHGTQRTTARTIPLMGFQQISFTLYLWLRMGGPTSSALKCGTSQRQRASSCR